MANRSQMIWNSAGQRTSTISLTLQYGATRNFSFNLITPSVQRVRFDENPFNYRPNQLRPEVFR